MDAENDVLFYFWKTGRNAPSAFSRKEERRRFSGECHAVASWSSRLNWKARILLLESLFARNLLGAPHPRSYCFESSGTKMAKIQEDFPDLVVGLDFGMTYTGKIKSLSYTPERILTIGRSCLDKLDQRT